MANKRILLGITGSVAAYKAAELVRLLTAANAQVEVAMTSAAQRFIGPATLQALSGRPVLTSMWDGPSPDGMDHIASVRKADIMVVAPASASAIARIANGFADDVVAALASASSCPVAVAPAMNREMWARPALQRNLRTLRGDGVLVFDPGAGELACGEHGQGRLAEPAQIVAGISRLLAGRALPLAGFSVAVSAGATVEQIDDMRVLTNRSSGKMGFALAEAAACAGAAVHLIAARVSVPVPAGMASVVNVGDVASMRRAALRLAPKVDAYASVAAVSDYRARKRVRGKLKRSDSGLSLELVPTADIIAEVAALPDKPYCVAFAAESAASEQSVKAARAKLRAKGVDAIVASPLAENLEGDSCELTFIPARGAALALGRISKRAAGDKIVQQLAKRLSKKTRLKSG